MKIKNIQLIIIFLFILTTNSFSDMPNNLNNDPLPILNIKNPNLYYVLDSILIIERECDYYRHDLVFNVFQKQLCDSSYIIKIEAIGYKAYGSPSNIGCFFYKKHLFLVEGKELDESLFKVSSKSHKLEYQKKNIEGEIVDYEIDSYSMWIYSYNRKVFSFENSYSKCKKNNSYQK